MSIALGFEEFVAAVDEGSLTGAAELLGVPRPTVSRRVARLEEELGVRLLHRSSRRLTLTREGEALYGKARYVVDTARAARQEVARLDGRPRGTLRVSVPSEMPAQLMARWASEFLVAHPEVRIELVATSTLVDLVKDGFDVVLRVGVGEDPNLTVRTFGRDRSIAVASPAYLDRRGRPRSPAELADHNCIVGYSNERPRRRWPLGDTDWVDVQGAFATNQMGMRMQAALEGFGIALVIERLALAHLREGTLEHVLPDVVGCPQRLCLAFVERRYLDPKIRLFVDFLVEKLTSVRSRGA